MNTFDFSSENVDRTNRIKNAGKEIMQIMVLEAQDFYKKHMSEDEFLKEVYGDIPQTNRTNEGVDFFKKVYHYLSASRSNETTDDIFKDIEKHESGSLTLALVDKAVLSSAAESIIANGSNEPAKRPWKKILQFLILILGTILDLL